MSPLHTLVTPPWNATLNIVFLARLETERLLSRMFALTIRFYFMTSVNLGQHFIIWAGGLREREMRWKVIAVNLC